MLPDDVIRRDECPKCGGLCLAGIPGTGEPALFCPQHPSAYPVERTYVAVDVVRKTLVDTAGERDSGSYEEGWCDALDVAEAAIAAVTGEAT